MAAIQLGRNSVRAKQIAPGAVGTSEVKNGGLKAIDFAKGQLPQSGLRNLVVRQFSTTVPGTCTEAGIPPTTIYFCNANEPTVTATCQAARSRSTPRAARPSPWAARRPASRSPS